jgi:hypothetical protein
VAHLALLLSQAQTSEGHQLLEVTEHQNAVRNNLL